MLSLPPLVSRFDATFLIRTDFSDPDSWKSLCTAAETPSAEGFLAAVDIVDDPVYSGLDTAAVGHLLPEQFTRSNFVFVADRVSMATPDHPILVVPVPYRSPELAYLNDEKRAEFRVVVTNLWSVENNLSLANMDWSDFTDHADNGVFRGFEPA